MRWMIELTGRGSAILAAAALAACAATPGGAPSASAPYLGPVIDVHLHALGASDQGPPPIAVCPGAFIRAHDPAEPWGRRFLGLMKEPPCADPIWSLETDDELRDATLAELERLNVTGVLSGPRERVAAWKARAPDRIIAGHQMNVATTEYSAEEVGAYFAAGGFEVLAEVTNQYAGLAADAPAFDAYWAVAAALDIPVGIHIGTGPPGSPYLFPAYRARLHSPLALEEILVRHPTLRVYVMHAGWPMRDDVMAMLYAHPQLYVGTGVLQLATPRAEYHDFLEDLVRAGFGDRILFGSDQMVWPGLIEEGIDAINDADFLTTEQKAAILHDNAARFLRLEED